MAQRNVPPQRKALFYTGMLIGALGLLSFISVFFSAVSNFGNFDRFEERGRSMGLRAITGIVMIIIGGALAHVGRNGLAGSGLKLDPQKARTDLEPWSRMTGGVVKDALDETGIKVGRPPNDQPASIEERLRNLRQLKEDGLINAQDYETAKQRILVNL